MPGREGEEVQEVADEYRQGAGGNGFQMRKRDRSLFPENPAGAYPEIRVGLPWKGMPDPDGVIMELIQGGTVVK